MGAGEDRRTSIATTARCAARMQDCVVSVLLGVPETLLDDERTALEVLADVGLAPRLRLVPIRRDGDSGVGCDDTR